MAKLITGIAFVITHDGREVVVMDQPLNIPHLVDPDEGEVPDSRLSRMLNEAGLTVHCSWGRSRRRVEVEPYIQGSSTNSYGDGLYRESQEMKHGIQEVDVREAAANRSVAGAFNVYMSQTVGVISVVKW